MSDGEVCGFEKDDGSTCGTAFGLCECHGRCWTHAPCKEQDRKQARSRGGKATAAKRRKFDGLEVPGPLETLEDAKSWLSEIAAQVVANRMPPRTAHAACRSIESWIEASKDATAQEEFEELREQLAELRRGEFEAVAGDG